ncbi:MAG: rhodanese-like domain-containing protein [Bacteroidota bacterium]
MFDTIKKIFGVKTTNYAELVKSGAIILDVRSKGEYAGGHIKGSVNIGVNQLHNSLNKWPKNQAIITCCASGMRSSTARGILKANGFTKVYNGGSWVSLQSKIK